RALLPDPDLVPRWVAEGRYPEVSFGVGLGHDLTAALDDLLDRLVEVLDEDVRPHARLARDGVIRAEVADDVPAAVLERRILALAADLPPEDRFVERRRSVRIDGGHPQIRDPAGPEYRVLAH